MNWLIHRLINIETYINVLRITILYFIIDFSLYACIRKCCTRGKFTKLDYEFEV